MDNLDTSLKQRNDFLYSNDFDKLMNEFRDKKDKSSVKIMKPKQLNQIEQTVQEYTPIVLGKPNTKKKKDIISLDIPMMGMIKPAPVQPEKESIFGQSFNHMSKDYDKKIIDKETGLPKAFTITTDLTNNTLSRTNNPQPIINTQTNPNIIPVTTNKDKEISQIEKENKDKISKMSIKEIEEYQKEIEIKLPTSLISKLKSGKLRLKLQKELMKLDIENQSIINEEVKSTEVISTNKKEIDGCVSKIKNKQCKMPYYNYLGKKTVKEVSETLSTKEITDKIDFTHNTFNELELNNKYYSLLEIYNFLCSSNENHIIFGLKILSKLIPNEINNDNELIKQLYSFINGLFYLIEHRNINIKNQAVIIVSKAFDFIFKDDLKTFLSLSFDYCLFPCIIIDSLFTNNNLLNDSKRKIVQFIINNSSKDFIRIIDNTLNKELKELLCNVSTYFYYICGFNKINKDLHRMISNETMINNDQLMILCLLYSSEKDLNKLKGICYNNSNGYKIKLIYLCICLLKNENSQIETIEMNTLLTKEYETFQSNIVKINCLFKLGDNIPSYLYSRQTDLTILSNALLALIKYATTNDYCSIVKNESQLIFFTNFYYASLNNYTSSKDYNDKLPLYSYWNSILTLYIKAFQYPKIINFYKMIDLTDILTLFPILSKELNLIIEKMSSNSIISKDKRIKSQYLYQFELFLITCLNFMRCFIKRYEPEYNKIKLSYFFIQLSNLINFDCEYYYFKFIKYFKIYFYKKYSSFEGEKTFPFISYKKIDEDLNFYLNSNEDLRRSTYLKRLMWIQSEELVKISIISTENDIQHRMSKYFPFDNNFLYQILYNKEVHSAMKINYLVIVIILFHDEKLTYSTNDLFELYLRTLIAFHPSDLMNINYSISVFEKYIQMLLFRDFGDIIENQFTLKSSENNRLVLENFFHALDVISSVNQLNLFYKSVILLLLFVHSHMNMNMNSNLKPYNYSSNLADVIYQHYNYLICNEYSLSFLSDNKGILRNKIVAFLMKNVHINNIVLYETLIMNYLKHQHFNKEKCSYSIIGDYSSELLVFCEINQNDYVKYVNNEDLIRQILTHKILSLNK